MNKKTTFIQTMILLALTVGIITGCTTPKAVERQHHERYEADTLAIQAQVDVRMKQVQQQMDSLFSERLSQYTSQQQQTEHQQETITETVTTTLDSLGREIRQEQRVISRDISREQQITEQRLTREFESRLQAMRAELDSSWQSRYNALQASVVRDDSTSIIETPVAIHEDNRPWYRRLWDRLQWLIVGIILALAALVMYKVVRHSNR